MPTHLELSAKVQHYWRELHTAFDREVVHSAPDVKINTRLRTTGGTASRTKNLIKIAPMMLNDDAPLDTIIAHEVSHIFNRLMLGGKGHDRLWQQCMIRLGLPPDRCHNYAGIKRNRPHTRHKFPCPNCNGDLIMTGHKIAKMRRGGIYEHTECKHAIVVLKNPHTNQDTIVSYDPRTKIPKIGATLTC